MARTVRYCPVPIEKTEGSKVDIDFGFFTMFLEESALRISREYFLLPRAAADAHYRERVYCYELYHQLRSIWPVEFRYSLGGEIDKSGHPLFRNGPYARSKPDLLAHRPGDMDGNLAIVEVKSIITDVAEVRDDLRKLTWFHHFAGYHQGLMLIFGDQETDYVREIVRHAANDLAVDRQAFICLHHRRVGEGLVPVG